MNIHTIPDSLFFTLCGKFFFFINYLSSDFDSRSKPPPPPPPMTTNHPLRQAQRDLVRPAQDPWLNGPGKPKSPNQKRHSVALAATPPTQSSATSTTTPCLSHATSARPAAATGHEAAPSATSRSEAAAGATSAAESRHLWPPRRRRSPGSRNRPLRRRIHRRRRRTWCFCRLRRRSPCWRRCRGTNCKSMDSPGRVWSSGGCLTWEE